MKILSLRRLRGPNVHLSRPALVARLDLGALAGRETSDITGFPERLLRVLPGLTDHHCAAGTPGGFVSRMRGGTYFGHVTEHVSIELSQLIGRDVSFGRTVAGPDLGVYDVIIECPVDESPESALPAQLLETAIELVTDIAAGATVTAGDVEPRLAALSDLAEQEATGPSTSAIIAAARRRGIPVERYDDLSLLRLGWGTRRRLAWAAMTDRTSGVGIDVAGDKQVTRRLLADAGVPVVPGAAAATVQDAARLLDEFGAPVVVKPRHGRQGRNVTLNVRTREDLDVAFAAAGPDVVVERQLPGRDYRVLVVAGEVVAAAERVPAHVVGDGSATVSELVARTNSDPRRGSGHSRALTRIEIDDTVRTVLRRQDLDEQSVPGEGQQVWLRDDANLSTGGTGYDVTDRIHPDVARLCLRVAAVIGLDIAGIDLRLPGIAAPVPPAGEPGPMDAGVIEVNAVPGLRMHLSPVRGRARDVGDAIVRAMFPSGSNGRIPTLAVTGTNGKTSVARMAAFALAGTGMTVGLTTTDGVSIDGRTVFRGDATGPLSAQMVLGDPAVQAAVLETARGGLLRRGLGYDWTDVGVITNITADHLGQDGLASIEDIAHVKALVAERVRDGGTLVLNADDPWVRNLVDRPRVRAERKRLIWFGADPHQNVMAAHLARGGTAYLLLDGWLVQATGARRTPLLRVADLPGTFAGAAPYVAFNALAAIAAARAMGAPAHMVTERLSEFEPRVHNPGRGTMLKLGEVTLFVDYAHNPAALAAVLRTLHRLYGPERCVALVTLPGDRRDDLLTACAQVLADGVTRAVLHDDEDPRGRAPGEVSALVEREMRGRRPGLRSVRTDGYPAAVDEALRMAAPGDVVLVLYESLTPMLRHLESLGAVPVDAMPVVLPGLHPAPLRRERSLLGELPLR
ncbi:cyanophycin synthetase [Actinoplanes sp. TFC3]|uniref:cyanophycin synthetase n=1 Tax=Actinoplanes sp. TFC3 TaxID=1710355 RepID=UPI00082AC62A|nr:cyanophycin synthetase [Actinoplanes sp. TFC3]